MIEEIFKPIEGYPGYFVSNFGNVMSKKRNAVKLMAICKTNAGYPAVALYQNRKMTIIQINRLVLAAFEGYPADPWLCVCRHLDGDKFNCNLDNLEWEVCDTTDEYDPRKSHRKGVLKPETTKEIMTQAKYHQSRETIQKAVINRRKTMEFLKYWKKKKDE